jgi:hypothetical protein
MPVFAQYALASREPFIPAFNSPLMAMIPSDFFAIGVILIYLESGGD